MIDIEPDIWPGDHESVAWYGVATCPQLRHHRLRLLQDDTKRWLEEDYSSTRSRRSRNRGHKMRCASELETCIHRCYVCAAELPGLCMHHTHEWNIGWYLALIS